MVDQIHADGGTAVRLWAPSCTPFCPAHHPASLYRPPSSSLATPPLACAPGQRNPTTTMERMGHVAGPSSPPYTAPAGAATFPRTPEIPLAHVPHPARPTGSSTPRITAKGWDLYKMCEMHDNFELIPRVSAQQDSAELARIISQYETEGKPLIVEGWNKRADWDGGMLSLEWMLRNAGADSK